FFNMRPVGGSPELFFNICKAMADMIAEYDDADLLIGVEMAALTLVGGTSVALRLKSLWQRIGYTRPLPKKARTPKEALEILKSIKSGVANYGQKDFVEARMRNGDKIAIFDDMATDLGSKIIARLIVLWQAEQRGISVECDKVFYLLNRNRNNREKGVRFADEPEQGLYPASLQVDYIIEFDDCFPALKKVMKPEEYKMIEDFQKDASRFQDSYTQREALRIADESRR
ncbi:MAG: hypothetical protein Q8O21_00380, partial [bacterium]|nr:hypothetical protein [bacterium]